MVVRLNNHFAKAFPFPAAISGKDMNQTAICTTWGCVQVFILTSGATVSAAELLCNNLKPYMQVIRIGATTDGQG